MIANPAIWFGTNLTRKLRSTAIEGRARGVVDLLIVCPRKGKSEDGLHDETENHAVLRWGQTHPSNLS